MELEEEVSKGQMEDAPVVQRSQATGVEERGWSRQLGEFQCLNYLN